MSFAAATVSTDMIDLDPSLPAHGRGVGGRDRRPAHGAPRARRCALDATGRACRRCSRSAFTAAARKDFGPLTDTPPVEDAALDADWRTAYPQRLAELAAAWRTRRPGRV